MHSHLGPVVVASALALVAAPALPAGASATEAAHTYTVGSALPGLTRAGTDARTVRSYVAALNQLRVAPRSSSAYRRAAYGPAWYDVDRNGCTQRQDALWRGLDRTRPATIRVRNSCSHEVFAGTWVDPYSGTAVRLTNAKDPRQAQRVQIDHVVALAEADRSGANGWLAGRKLAFANDLLNLVSSDGQVNQAKGASDAASWRPKAAYQCAYAARVVTVKKKWALNVDASEKKALAQMLGTCKANSIHLGPPVPTASPTKSKPAPTAKPAPKPTPNKKPARPTRDYDCNDFGTWAAADRMYRVYYPYYGDVFRLDADGDRIVCESLPGAP